MGGPVLDIQPLIREFFAAYKLDVAEAGNRDEVVARCRNLVVEEAREFTEAMADFRFRQTRVNRISLAGEAADVRYVIGYTAYALDLPLYDDAPGYGATFDARLGTVEAMFNTLMFTEPDSTTEASVRIALAMELSHLDVMAHRDAVVEARIDLNAVVEAVHEANMRKVWPDGTVHYREDGKVLKPPNWVPADIESIIFGGVDSDAEAA